MERNRETRRGTPAISGSFSSSRRRSRGSCEIEDGGNDSLPDRSRRDRPSRRRRLSSNESFHVDRDEVGDGSSDESLDEEHEDEDEPVQGGSGNSSLRRTGRGKPQWKGSDEVIGVSVPRKARSASAKRSQDSFLAVRLSSSSSPGRTATSLSPPSSNASMKSSKRLKPAATKSKPTKTTKGSFSASEAEVAQFLYGLTRLQSDSPPPKPEVTQCSSPNCDVKHNLSNEGSVSVASKASSPLSTPISPPLSSRPMVLPQHSSPTQAPTVMAPKRKKPRAVQLEGSGNPPVMVACSSKPPGSSLPGKSISPVAANPVMEVEADGEHMDRKAEILSPKSDTNVEPNNPVSPKAETSIPKDTPLSEEKLSPSSPAETKSAVLMRSHSTISANKEENQAVDADGQSSMDQNNPIIQKELSSSTQDLPSMSMPDVKLKDSKIDRSSMVSAMVEEVKGPKFEIDLMAPPENCYPDDCMPDVSDRSACHESGLVVDEISMKSKGITDPSAKDTEGAKVKQDCCPLASQEKIQTKEAVEAVTLSKQPLSDKKPESVHHEHALDKAGNKQHSQKISKSTSRQIERTAPPVGIMTSSSTSIQVPIPGWPGGLPPFGYLGSSPASLSGLPSFQGGKPVEGNSAIPNPPFVMLPPPRTSRCATHLFIAHLIHYQQQLARLNPFWHAAGSTALYGARPYNMNILPPSDALLLGSSVIRNPNFPANSNIGSGSLVTLNSHNVKEKAPNTSADSQRKQHIPPQSAQQGAAFMFPFTQPRTGETKSSASTDNSASLSVPAASAAANTKFSNIATASDPQFMTMLPSNYPYPIPPSYRAHVNPQQQSADPFFGGSFYPSPLMQLQPHSLSQTQIPTTSTGSLSSQKHLQAQQCLPTSMPLAEARHAEPEPTGNSEVPLSQKKLQVHNFSGHPAFPSNFPPNFPVMATALVGKQHPPGDPSLQMSMKAMEVARPVLPGHAMLQTMSDVGQKHYHLGHHLQIQTGNPSKTPGKAAASAKGSDKPPESIHSQSTVAAVQQLQKQAMAQTKPSIPALTSAAPAGGTAYTDRVPLVYPSGGSNLAAGSMGFPTMQFPPQWKMQSSQRVVQAGPSANAIVQPAAAAAVTAKPSAGSPSGQVTKLPSPPVNSSRKAIHSGSPVLTQSAQGQTLGKATQLFSNSEPVLHHSSSTASAQKRHGDPNLSVQPMFPGGLNMRRPTNQQTQQGSPVLTVASSSGFLAGGGGKGPAVYNPLAGSSVAVMAGASYVKSAEQKPATA